MSNARRSMARHRQSGWHAAVRRAWRKVQLRGTPDGPPSRLTVEPGTANIRLSFVPARRYKSHHQISDATSFFESLQAGLGTGSRLGHVMGRCSRRSVDMSLVRFPVVIQFWALTSGFLRVARDPTEAAMFSHVGPKPRFGRISKTS
jgi:hypothetical protein